MGLRAGKVSMSILVASVVAGSVAFGGSMTLAAPDAYTEVRTDLAFQAAAEVPAAAPLAEKGDLLPTGCAGPPRPDVQSKCIDTAYELPSGPSVVAES